MFKKTFIITKFFSKISRLQKVLICDLMKSSQPKSNRHNISAQTAIMMTHGVDSVFLVKLRWVVVLRLLAVFLVGI